MEGQVTETDLNNAGVVYMRCGQFQVAWDLFKGALELHLARQKQRANSNVRPSHTAEAFILRAKDRYNRFVSSRMASHGETTPSVLIEGHGEDDYFCHFFLFRNPIKIPRDFREDSLKACFSGLIIILNMALLEHYRNPSAKQSMSLYRLAASLLTGRSPAEASIELIIMNNVGVWHQQNGNVSIAEKYMERAAKAAQTLSSDSPFTLEEWQGIQFNLQWFAAPRFKISPAA